MTKKLSRREFLKGTGKVTATLATIWAVGGALQPPEVAPVVEEGRDIYNKECHPYFCEGGYSISWTSKI